MTDPHLLERLRRGVVEVFPDSPEDNLWQRVATAAAPLRIKLGIDPTGTDIHLGHSIVFRKLRAFQDAGHTAVLLIGDFTARIGDPTGKSEVRRQLSEAEVQANARTYLDQIRPILDFDTPGRLEIRRNSEWLSKLDLSAIIQLLATMTVGQMLAKEGFAERMSEGNPVYLHEFLYPLMQGYDSVAVQADVELGGTDQKFNLLVGRDLQKHFGLTPQYCLTLPLLLGLDGHQKMSKSLGNYVGMSEDPLSLYSKLEKVPDSVVLSYFELLTNLPLEQLPTDPRERQKHLALDVVSQYFSPEIAQQAQADARALVTEGNAAAAAQVPEFSLSGVQFPVPLFYLLSTTGLCASSSEARRQIQSGAVRVDGQKIDQVELRFESADTLLGKVLQVGKKRFLRLGP